MDLDLDHYGLDELLALFKLPPNFSASEFKAAKRIVYQVHPDKSGLDKEYFTFFSSAYRLLEYVNKTKHCVSDKYEPEFDQAKKELAKRFSEADDFQSKFNELFEKHYVPTEDERRGHGDWFKSDADLGASYESRKREARALAVTVEPIGSSLRASSLDGESYVDLKQSYTVETVVGVSDSDLQTRPTLEVLKQERATPLKPLSRAEAEHVFLARAEQESIADTRRAFKLVKHAEAAKPNIWNLLE